jgi:hypothetical protein
MSTTTISSNKSITVTNNLSWYETLIKKAEFSYFGLIAMTISIGSILGGISAMYIFQNDAPIWQLGITMSISMANNVAAIGQAPARWVVNLFALCVVLNLLMIVINL